MSDQSRPDAIMMPAHGYVGDNDFDRLLDVRARARKALGVRPDDGEKAYCRPMPAGQGWFCTRDRNDSILFPYSHPLAGRPRYKWTKQPGGMEFGTLVPEATMEVPADA